MKKQIKLFATLITVVSILIGISGCGKKDIENYDILIKLYNTYKNGEISECQYNGQTVYCATLNVYDAGNSIFDKDGELIGRCDYALGNVDTISKELKHCEAIYRVESNIWGEPAVDKYNLAK